MGTTTKTLIVGVLLLCSASVAEAGVLTDLGDVVLHPIATVKNAASYLFAPVNCVGNFGVGLIKSHDGASGDLVTLGKCVWVNANRSPITLTTGLLP